MTIIGRGDLMPPHSHRPLGRYVTVALVVLLVGGGGFAAYKGLKGKSGDDTAAKLPICAKTQPTKQKPAKQKTTITVNNATLTAGLATQVAAELRTRGFTVGTIGNTPTTGKGVAVVKYSPDREVVAQQLAAQFDGAKLVAVGGNKSVEVDVGPQYTALQSKHAASVAFSQFETAASASATPLATPTTSPSCRARSVKSTRG